MKIREPHKKSLKRNFFVSIDFGSMYIQLIFIFFMVKAKTFQFLKKDKIGHCLRFLLLELIQKREWNV
jgi:hypothetical protein